MGSPTPDPQPPPAPPPVYYRSAAPPPPPPAPPPVVPSLFFFIYKILPALFLIILITGCVSKKVPGQGIISAYQESLVTNGPQDRAGTGGLEPISPAEDHFLPPVNETIVTTGKKKISLTLNNAVVRVLANSPEIKVVSFDPSIAGENIGIAASEFDVTAFGQVGYDRDDFLPNDLSDRKSVV